MMSMNSESRTSNIVNTININQFNFINRTRQLIRRCSFCRCAGHNVTNCNDERLVNFNESLVEKKNELQYLPDAVTYFQVWLISLDPELIKAYAVRYCGANMRTNIELCVVKILQHIWLTEIQTEININTEDYIPLIQEIIRENNIEYLDLRLSTFLHEITSQELQSSENRKHNIKVTLCIQINDELEDCSVCYNDIKNSDMVTLNCNHRFCGTCVKKILITCNIDKTACCALCRGQITTFHINNQEIFDNLKENLN